MRLLQCFREFRNGHISGAVHGGLDLRAQSSNTLNNRIQRSYRKNISGKPNVAFSRLSEVLDGLAELIQACYGDHHLNLLYLDLSDRIAQANQCTNQFPLTRG